MIDWINIGVGILTIAFGAFGFLAPRFTLEVLDLSPTRSTMGLSEARASVGGLFVAMGLVAVITGAPWAYAAIGVAYTGAAAGRILSLVFDSPPMGKLALYFGIEAACATWLLWANWSAL
ncbi:MAG: DUF4345 family protein [Pseudomonadota bacterium]